MNEAESTVTKPEMCAYCGQPIFGGPGGWHTEDGRERCPSGTSPTSFHEPTGLPVVTDLDAAKRWVAEVQAAYRDGGYAAGDGPSPPLEEMEWLIAEVERLSGRAGDSRD